MMKIGGFTDSQLFSFMTKVQCTAISKRDDVSQCENVELTVEMQDEKARRFS